MYYDKDADLKLLSGKTIGIVGFGSQGHAHALNLRDSGCSVMVAEAKGSDNWKAAKKAGFKVGTAEAVSKEADVMTLLVPDSLHPAVYREMEKGLTKGKMLIFAHGFNIHYNQVVPPPDIDVTMVAPKCPGHMLRQTYTEGSGPPALVAVHQDATATDLHRGLRSSGLGGGPSGRDGEGQEDGAGLCQRHRVHTGRRHGHHVPRRDRDRPVR